MSAGKMDRKIRLLRFGVGSPATNEFNEPVGAWGELAAVWAEYTPVSDGERWRAGEVMAQITARFRIYWSSAVSDLNPKDRLEFDGDTFEIHGVKEVGRRKYLEITAAARLDK